MVPMVCLSPALTPSWLLGGVRAIGTDQTRVLCLLLTGVLRPDTGVPGVGTCPPVTAITPPFRSWY